MPRKYPYAAVIDALVLRSFNEAGADAPEILTISRTLLWHRKSFNEAGADAPEIPLVQLFSCVWSVCFNEAGADAPEIQ